MSLISLAREAYYSVKKLELKKGARVRLVGSSWDDENVGKEGVVQNEGGEEFGHEVILDGEDSCFSVCEDEVEVIR